MVLDGNLRMNLRAASPRAGRSLANVSFEEQLEKEESRNHGANWGMMLHSVKAHSVSKGKFQNDDIVPGAGAGPLRGLLMTFVDVCPSLIRSSPGNHPSAKFERIGLSRVALQPPTEPFRSVFLSCMILRQGVSRTVSGLARCPSFSHFGLPFSR
jgi:hypothetical protein